MLSITPINLKEANEFVRLYHRHLPYVKVGYKFAVAASDLEGVVRGVAIIGRPIARRQDDGWTLEVNRCCTDGAKNACSMLYGAAWRAARALGYLRLITYTLSSEGGASLRGAGWRCLGQRKSNPRGWNMRGRPRVEMPDLGPKTLWEVSDVQ